jgi:hypothetical protein
MLQILRSRRLASLLVAIGLASLCVPVRAQSRPAPSWPDPDWDLGSADSFSAEGLSQAIRYAESAGGSGMIIHRGKQIRTWGDLDRRYDVKSATKSIGTIALGLALANQPSMAPVEHSAVHPVGVQMLLGDRYPGCAARPWATMFNRDAVVVRAIAKFWNLELGTWNQHLG